MTSSIDICSNGFIWLVSGASQATQDLPSVTQLVQGPARLAVFWTDLDVDYHPALALPIAAGVFASAGLVLRPEVAAISMSGVSRRCAP